MALNGLPELADFALTGGTNLALRYGHRLSIDLDFFTPHPFNTQALIERLGQIVLNAIAHGGGRQHRFAVD